MVLQEASPANVTAQLAAALAKPPKPISAAEMAQIRARFAWGALVPAFYERLAAELQCVRCCHYQLLVLPSSSSSSISSYSSCCCYRATKTQ